MSPSLRRFHPTAVVPILALGACARPAALESTTPRPELAASPGVPAALEPPAAPPAWGGLRPGRHHVGFRRLVYDDASRSYRLHTESQAHPRPIVAGVWYPAQPDTGEVMTLADYFVVDTSQREQAVFTAVVSSYLHEVLVEEVFQTTPELMSPDERVSLDRVLHTAGFARHEASLAVKEGPLLLAHPGLGGAYCDNLVLYEYLASHGWVVVAGLFEQATGQWINVDWDPANSVRDLDSLRREVPRSLAFTPRELAVIGHSYGAQAALVYASLPGRVDAVVSLDSTIDRDSKWWKDEDHGPWLDRAPSIRVPALLFASEGSSRAFFDEMGAVPREFVTVPGLAHNDFEGLGGALRPLAGACPSEPDCQRIHQRYLAIVSSTADFLDSTLRGVDHSRHVVDGEGLAALGLRRERALEPSTTPPTTRALRSFEETTPDCRDDGSCDPVDRTIYHALELLALDRAPEALGMVEALLAGNPAHWMLHDVHGRVLATLGRHDEAARAFDAERSLFESADQPSGWAKAMGARARERRDRALTLAAHPRATPRAGATSSERAQEP